MQYFFELLLSGITRGSIYALIALGYTMVYGIVGLINFAHGEIYMLGAFTGLIIAGVLTTLGFNLFAILVISLAGAMLYSAAYGYTIEKVAYKPLRHAPRLSPLISAIGMSIFLQNYVLLAQTADFQAYPDLIPSFSFMEPFEQVFRSTELVIVTTTSLFMLLLFAGIKYSKIGKAMRAISQDKQMALLLGVNIDKVISFTFVIGSALAAVGGVLISIHNGQINYYIGFIVGIKAFTAAVLGGIGSIPEPRWAD